MASAVIGAFGRVHGRPFNKYQNDTSAVCFVPPPTLHIKMDVSPYNFPILRML